MDEGKSMMQSGGDSCSCGCGYGCGMGKCGGCYGGHGHHLLRWLLGLAILLIIFWLGFRLGEFNGAFEGSYGGHYRLMQYGGYGSMMPGYNGTSWGPGMMNQTPTTTLPAPAPKK